MRRLFLAFALFAPAIAHAQVSVSGGIVQSVNGIAPNAGGNVLVPTTQFVTGFTPGSGGTVASLLSGTPCVSAIVGYYADVVDLYNNGVAGGGIDDVLRCRYDATNVLYK